MARTYASVNEAWQELRNAQNRAHEGTIARSTRVTVMTPINHVFLKPIPMAVSGPTHSMAIARRLFCRTFHPRTSGYRVHNMHMGLTHEGAQAHQNWQ
jgi:hypothetical protein